MGHMAKNRMEVTNQVKRTKSGMVDCWKLWRGEGIDIDMILVLILIGTTIIIDIILT